MELKSKNSDWAETGQRCQKKKQERALQVPKEQAEIEAKNCPTVKQVRLISHQQ